MKSLVTILLVCWSLAMLKAVNEVSIANQCRLSATRAMLHGPLL